VDGRHGVDLAIGVHSMAPAGGTELNVFQVARGLARRGHAVDLVAARPGALAGEYRTFCRSVTRRPPFDFARASAPRDLVRMTPAVLSAARKKPDVVYPNRFAEIVWAAAVGRLSRSPVVCHLHEIRHARPGSFPNEHVRRFIAVSEFLRGEWAAVGLNPEHIDVVHNGVSCDDYPMGGASERAEARGRLGLPQDGFVALYYGRLDPEKGLEVLLDAWGRLGAGDAEGRLLIVGSVSAHLENGAGYLERLRESAPPGCVWVPAQSDVVGPLHAADVVVVPSVWAEPFGRVIVEAMATGRPALASRVGGIPEIMTGEFERFLVEPGDAGVLTRGLESLVGWQEREPSLADRCRAHVRDHFSLDRVVDGVERSLARAAGERRGKGSAWT
jgi:glycosyltransferase involved in cell wall biosynthesis